MRFLLSLALIGCACVVLFTGIASAKPASVDETHEANCPAFFTDALDQDCYPADATTFCGFQVAFVLDTATESFVCRPWWEWLS